uniref:Uncharacterized protein n=1 Tax=Candidatus Kentrum sp. LPFa TaxID=2126335 RepID=A0A450W222_9GAMM|nr:MAG: hypothetical protein BECKLPF1236A_GA0070988_1004812 [Candidatus Kentron sp. LPFa]VFK27409.1 MAG: hypothetical protein BECKLPF1236C_GA0070990_1004612 [Candidatus Kentron sp. LPFa]
MFTDSLRLLHEVQNLVAQGGATKIKCNKHLILKDRENHIFLDPLLCRARDGSCKVLSLFISRSALRMDRVLTVLHKCRMMVHFSLVKPR